MQYKTPGVYAIWDKKAADYVGPLQLHRADAVAIRSFGDLVADKQTYIGQHAEDYSLVLLGHLDEEGLHEAVPTTTIDGSAIRAAQEASNAS